MVIGTDKLWATHTNNECWGIGKSHAESQANGIHEIMKYYTDGRQVEIETTRCTYQLYRRVHQNGGHIKMQIRRDGLLDLAPDQMRAMS